jgi:dGTPase
LQTLDGVLCHCGEKAFLEYRPNTSQTFKEFYTTLNDCYFDETKIKSLKPYTLEGCVVRISDMIAYMGKDRQDSYRANLKIPEFKKKSADVLGTNKAVINNLICNIVKNSIDQPFLKMDEAVFDEFIKTKDENDKYIYANTIVEKPYFEIVKPMMDKLYPVLLNDVLNKNTKSYVYQHHISNKAGFLYKYYGNPKNKIDPNDMVVDYIASMTDDYFVDLFAKIFPDDPLSKEIDYVSYFQE